MAKKKLFDPRLKAAMQEIREIMQRYDIAGQITLVSPTHSEFLMEFPTWSLVQPETNDKGEMGIRFSSNRFNFATNKGKQHAVDISIHILAQFRQNAIRHFGIVDEMLEMIKQEPIEIIETPAKPHPHDLDGEIAAHDPKNQAGKKQRGFSP